MISTVQLSALSFVHRDNDLSEDTKTNFNWRLSSAHPETPSRGEGSNSRNDPGLWIVNSDSTQRAEHAHICETSQRVANSEIIALWSWNFGPRITLFFGQIVNFLTTGGGRAIYGKTFFRYGVPPSPYDSLNVENRKVGNFWFSKPNKWSPKDLPTPLFKYLY